MLRVGLYSAFHDGAYSVAALSGALAYGLVADLLTALVVFLPIHLLLVWTPARLLRIAPARAVAGAAVGGAVGFSAFVEWFFFDEFNARFNHIALDYLLHPKEVFVNIWDSYDVPLFVGLAVVLGLGFGIAAALLTRRAEFPALRFPRKLLLTAGAIVAATVAVFGLRAMPDQESENRITAEVAANGATSLVHAFRTAELPFHEYYRTLPAADAHERAAHVLGLPEPESLPDGKFLIERPEPASLKPAHPWDVVVIVEESLGSEFVGVLGHPERKLTPGIDRWSKRGTLLTNLVATGNRTVRGLEATLASFVPLPGDAILKRDLPGSVATLGSVFRESGYRTVFYYGGWGVFDSMKPFFLKNGWDEFVERDSFPEDSFATIWGVADEYVFDALLRRQEREHAAGRPFFATVMSVSNHKPYDVPDRPTLVPAKLRNREAAVAYADWALADYLDRADAAGVLDHTLVLVVGDHGARVYGSEEIPAASYRIPALFVVPGEEWAGRTIDRLASQIDLAPTLLSLLGLQSDAPFLGEDLTALPGDGGRAFVSHNRDFGILTDTALVTLGLKGSSACYTRPGRASDVFTREKCDAQPSFLKLRDDATAVFETASDLIDEGEYALPPDGPAGVAQAAAGSS